MAPGAPDRAEFGGEEYEEMEQAFPLERVKLAEKFEEIQTQLIGLASGQLRLEAAVASLPTMVAAAVTSRELRDDETASNFTIAKRPPSPGARAYRHIRSNLSNESKDVRVAKMDSVADGTSWPKSLELHDGLAVSRKAIRRSPVASREAQRFSLRASIGPGGTGSSSYTSPDCMEDFLIKQVRRCPVVHPDSYWLIPQKVAICIALVHDLIIQPFVLAWDVRETDRMIFIAQVVLGYWIFDLVLNFFVGFYNDGELERGIKVVAQQYLKSWFLPDFAAVIGDGLSMTPPMRIYLGRRFSLRSLGIIRLHKLVTMFDSVLEKGLSDNWRMAWKGMRLAFFMLWLNHIICCAWYNIGVNAPTDTGGRWLDTMESTGEEIRSTHEMYRYATAFHWSMGHVTAGGVENLSALNSVERCYSIFIMMFGVFAFSSIISAISSAMTQIKLAHQGKTEKMRALRLYLSQHAVTQRMAIRVQQQVSERLAKKKRLVEKDVPALAHLSSTLRAELRFEISGPHILRLPLLRVCVHIDQGTVRGLCAEAIDVMYLSRTDPLFTCDTPAVGCYSLVSGFLCYSCRNSIFSEDVGVTDVTKGAWLSEAALWTKWKHVGNTEAMDACEVLAVQATSFLNGLLKNELIGCIVREYAKQYHKGLQEAVPPRSPLPTDLLVPFTEHAEVVLAMEPSTQQIVCAVSLHHLRNSQTIETQHFADLAEQVTSGKCAVMLNREGQAERAVSITVLHIERNPGEVLVHLGKLKDGQLDPRCRLPGTKQDHHQTQNEATEKLNGRLQPLVGMAKLDHTTQTVEWKDSLTYGMRTRYFHTIHHAIVETPPETLLDAAPRNAQLPDVDGVPDIYVLVHDEDKSGFDFYAWLRRDEFMRLSSIAGSSKEEIAAWLNALDLDVVRVIARDTPNRVSERRLLPSCSDLSGTRSADRLGPDLARSDGIFAL